MATFQERAVIRRDATLNPWSEGFVAPPNTTLPAVQATWRFVGQIQSALADIAYDIIEAASSTSGSPETGPPTPGTPEADQLEWARQVNRRQRDESPIALNMILSEFDTTAPAEFANVGDAAIKEFLITLVPILAADIRRV